MLLEAIYDHGTVRFLTPPPLDRGPQRITIELLDPVPSSSLSPETQVWLDRLDAIRNAPPTSDDVPLAAKQIERLKAFNFREGR